MLSSIGHFISTRENHILIVFLSILIMIYSYLLVFPTHELSKLPNFVIQRDTLALWQKWQKDQSSASANYKWGDDIWGKKGSEGGNWNDNYALDDFKQGMDTGPNVPSDKYRCPPHPPDWIAIRSEVNYKYMWMHSNENMYMGATATLDTPIHRKSFEVVPVYDACGQGGWVRLRESDSQGFLRMIPPVNTTKGEISMKDDEWTVQIGSSDLETTVTDQSYQFLIEEEGYLLNRGSNAFVNVFADNDYIVKGHASGWREESKHRAAGREFGAQMHFQFVNASEVQEAINEEAMEVKEVEEEDQKYLQQIAALPKSTEKRVISYGLYGTKEKYTIGAIKNVEMAKLYFPGWIVRFYVTSDVPKKILDKLVSLNAEIKEIPSGKGYISGMFWRFLVAADETVDRYIVRDVDSRPNARDRLAVEEWIQSGVKVHILRDHVNHCIPMNGGMWGGVKGVLSDMQERVEKWQNKDAYMDDLNFLEESVWPDIKDQQLAHDSYCCDRYSHTKPFPTQRPKTYQHVGQVFDSHDNPRLLDIDAFIRGVPVPGQCRKEATWIYG